ncbi:hypothetical protein [Streptomyces chartreusis]|uniref:hypothetical protein n=1 Tax=Streptomyces chartreusis TaxID=1969 RepID=UPI0033E1B5FD
MSRYDHYEKSKELAERAEEFLGSVDDPGAAAQTLALLAIAHAVLEAEYSLYSIRQAMEQQRS